jgi:RNA polymerase sigma-70 factor (ECF subfamily)
MQSVRVGHLLTVEAVIEPATARALVAQAAVGDEVAFARIVAAHHDDMARVAYVVCGDVDLAQDAVQAAWPLVWRKLGTIRDPERLRPWLVAVAANEARQLVRRRGRRQLREIAIDPELGVAAPARSSDPAAFAAELDLARAIETLDPIDRTIVGLRYAAGLTSGEIGTALGMTSGAVRSRLVRLIARLRKELDA